MTRDATAAIPAWERVALTVQRRFPISIVSCVFPRLPPLAQCSWRPAGVSWVLQPGRAAGSPGPGCRGSNPNSRIPRRFLREPVSYTYGGVENDHMPGIRLAALVRRLRPDAGACADAALVARFAATRDEAAFELLVRRHGAMVLAACQRILGHTEDAEDAFQAAFLVLARKAASARRGTAIPAWLHRVAVRIARRVASRRHPTTTLVAEPPARPAPDEAERSELRGLLDAEIDRLSEPFRRAFVLCYLEGLSNADAAQVLGCPVGTVESRLTAARRKLRNRSCRGGSSCRPVEFSHCWRCRLLDCRRTRWQRSRGPE